MASPPKKKHRKPTKQSLQKFTRLEKSLSKVRPSDDPFKVRFDAHFPRTEEPLVVVLKGHLLAEEMLYALVERCVRDVEGVRAARLSFAQILSLAKAVSPYPTDFWIWSSLTDLNLIRNRLAHGLDAKDTEQRIERLWRSIANRRRKSDPSSKENDDSLAAQLAFLMGYMAAQCQILDEARRLGALDLLEGRLAKPAAIP